MLHSVTSLLYWCITYLQANNFGSEFPVVCIFKKLCDTDTDGDIYIKQWGKYFAMPAYIFILEDGKDNSKGLEKVANIACSEMN